MIGVPEKNRFCAVNLLKQEASHDLMRPSHSAKAHQRVCPLANGIGKSVRTAYDEGEITPFVHLLPQHAGKGGAGHVFAAFIKRNYKA